MRRPVTIRNPYVDYGAQHPPPWSDEDRVVELVRGYLVAFFEVRKPAEEVSEAPPKRGPGRPRMLRAERLERTTTHRAQAMARVAELVLRDLYPKDSKKAKRECRDRAVAAARAATGVKKKTIRNLMGRKKRDRRRIF